MEKCDICNTDILEYSNRYKERLNRYREHVHDEDVIICDDCIKKIYNKERDDLINKIMIEKFPDFVKINNLLK